MRIGWKAALNDPAVASFRFRVLQPLRALAARGHQVELFRPEAADGYDLVVFCKSYRPADAAIARAVRARGGRVVLDLCDNHFFNPYHLPRYNRARDELLAMIAQSDRVVASTPALARVVQAEAGLDHMPLVVGDAVEPITLPPAADPRPRQLLWFGSHGSPNAPSGMTDLLRIAEPLRAQAARTPFELVVASNDQAKFDRVAPELGIPARYVPWTVDGFPALLAAASAVVIPLSDNPFVACKTHNRLSTALWAGVPVVADDLESYRAFAPFAWLDDWADGLRIALEEPVRARARAAGARAFLERHWTMATLAPAWEEALGLARGRPVEPSPPVAARGPARPPLYQAALDPVGEARITGWARVIAHPPRPVLVTLEEGGRAAGEGRATLPRPDLAAVGFADSDCGFVLPVPAGWRDGRPRRFSVVADGIHVIETLSARFAPETDGSPAAADPPAPPPLPAVPRAPERVREDVRLQKRLADDLEALDRAVDQVRSIAARIILAAAGGDRHGAPLAIGELPPDEDAGDGSP
jgi:glycosyltransferase involved in cell wall biosynthesis